MSTEQAFNDLENTKATGYENALKPANDFYCIICKTDYEFDDLMIELDRSITDRSGNTTWVGTCERCWL